MSARRKFLCLLGILIIATFLRVYRLTATPPGLCPDEAINGNNAAEAAATWHFQVFYPENNGREGLYINILAVLFGFFHAPHEPWAVRVPAAITGVLTVLGLYLLAAELFGDGAGLLGAFLLATSFWHINFSRIGFRAILSPLLLVWALYLLIKAERSASSRAAIWYAAVAGVVYALGFYTYIAYRVTPLLFLLFIPFFTRNPGFFKRGAIFVIAAFITAAPIGWYFLKHPADFLRRTSDFVASWGNPVASFATNAVRTLLMFNFRGDANWRHNVSGAPELFWPVGILFILGIVLGLYALFKDWRGRTWHGVSRCDTVGTPPLPSFPLLLIFSWSILAMLPAVLPNEGIPHALRSILMLPPAIMFAGIGGVFAYGFIRAHWGAGSAKTIAAVFLAAVAVFAYVDYFIVWSQNPNVPDAFSAKYVALARKINTLAASIPKYVVVDARGVMVRGLPMSAETTMFVTNTFLADQQSEKNVHYLLPAEAGQIPKNTPPGDLFFIR